MTVAGFSSSEHRTVRCSLSIRWTRHGILQKLLAANGAPANASNLALVQDVYFRGMWMALAQSERRYGGKIVEADDFVDQILKDRVRPVPGNFEMPVERMQQ